MCLVYMSVTYFDACVYIRNGVENSSPQVVASSGVSSIQDIEVC